MTRFRAVLSLLATLLCLLVTAPAFGQDDSGTMTFGEEEAADVDDGDGDQGDSQQSGGGEEEGTMTFGTQEAAEAEKGSKPTVGLVAVPTDALDSSQRQRLQNRLAEAVTNIEQQVEEIQVQTGDAVLTALKKRTVATCVTEPLCLGSTGDEAGVDRIVLARVQQDGSSFQLDVDYFNVKDRLFIKYRSVEDLGSFRQVVKEIDPVVKEVFEIRQERETPNYAEQNTGAAQTVVAIGCAALSAGALAGGIVFGNKAAGVESDLNSHEKNEAGVYEDSEFTQKEAQKMLNEAEGHAELANISYGLSGAFAIASGVLFLIDSGSDVAEESRRAGLLRRIDVSPSFGKSGAGIRATFDF